jgi:hypothetical protein
MKFLKAVGLSLLVILLLNVGTVLLIVFTHWVETMYGIPSILTTLTTLMLITITSTIYIVLD